MNKKQLVEKIAIMSNSSKKEAEFYLDIIIEAITNTLSLGEPIKIVGYGKFQISQRKAKKGRNIATGEPIIIPPKKVVTFKPGEILKSVINN